jgi:hypothetical protein
MYDLLRQHLKPHGIIQMWYPGCTEPLVTQAVIRSAVTSFPHVRGFISIEGWGLHILASEDPIDVPPAAQLVARMPADAQNNLIEWFDDKDLAAKFSTVLSQEVPVHDILGTNSPVQSQITDDNPINEYFLLRREKLF